MKFDNITQIQQHQFVGNAFSDQEAFNAIHDFVMSVDITIRHKAEALRVMSDKGMGCGRDEHITDHDIVQQYVELCSD